MPEPDLPGRTYDCFACEQTYLAGAKAGAGPFYCHFCHRPLVLRPAGAEPYEPGPGYQPFEETTNAGLQSNCA